jgi:cytochrome P450
VEYSPFAYAIHDDPYPTYRWLRDHAPVYRHEKLGFHALSRWQDVWDATLDWRTYSSTHGVTLENQEAGLRMIITMDPPEHDRVRKAVAKAFTPRRTAELERAIRGLLAGYTAPLAGRRDFDLVEAIAARLPMDVISELLGIPPDERARIRKLANDSSLRLPDDPVPPRAAVQAMSAFRDAFPPLIEARRRAPQDDLISELVRVEVEREDGGTSRLTDLEILSFCVILGFAGHETTAKMLSSAVYWLWRFPEQRSALVRDPGLLPNAVEELLRYDTPSQYQGRWTTRDVTLHGTTIPKDSRVLLLTGAANRDERHFPDPDGLDVQRPVPVHLSFGYGHHLCLGKSLARLELVCALEAILRLWPEYEVDPAASRRIHGGNVQRGFERLALRV